MSDMPKHIWVVDHQDKWGRSLGLAVMPHSGFPDTTQYTNTQQLKERLEGMRKSYNMRSENQVENEIYNQAINDILGVIDA